MFGDRGYVKIRLGAVRALYDRVTNPITNPMEDMMGGIRISLTVSPEWAVRCMFMSSIAPIWCAVQHSFTSPTTRQSRVLGGGVSNIKRQCFGYPSYKSSSSNGGVAFHPPPFAENVLFERRRVVRRLPPFFAENVLREGRFACHRPFFVRWLRVCVCVWRSAPSFNSFAGCLACNANCSASCSVIRNESGVGCRVSGVGCRVSCVMVRRAFF
jgi:hypothetical protein